MYAVEIKDSANTIYARDLNDPANSRTYSGRNLQFLTFHRSAIITSSSGLTTSLAILKSVVPWVDIYVPKLRTPHGYGTVDSIGNVIGDRFFRLVTKHICPYISYLWDNSSKDARVIPLCNQQFSRGELSIAQWRSHAWVVKYPGWEEQIADSRELCTIVDFTHAKGEKCISIAAGEGRLYGHVLRGIDLQHISAIDPRESDVAREVYRDDDTWFHHTFRDVPNGVAVVRICMEKSMHHVNIFDERACAMIGTPIMLKSYEYLFCMYAAAYN